MNQNNQKYFQYYIDEPEPVQQEYYSSESSEDTSDEEIDLKWIVKTCPKTKLLRSYFKAQILNIEEESEFNF